MMSKKAVQTKEFHLGDLLSVSTNYLLSPRHMAGLLEILEFMTADKLFADTTPQAIRICEKHIIEQHPQLATPEMDFAIAELKEMLKSKSGKAEPEKLIVGWLSKQVLKYGEMFTVSPIPAHAYETKGNKIHVLSVVT